jgi:hypothetical protein
MLIEIANNGTKPRRTGRVVRMQGEASMYLVISSVGVRVIDMPKVEACPREIRSGESMIRMHGAGVVKP